MKESKKWLPKIHNAGRTIVGTAILCTIVIAFLSDFWGLIAIVLALWCVYFFRDPDRITPITDDIVISPADGVVQMVKRNVPYPSELSDEPIYGNRISIFLNIFNVHVNRIPVSGVVTNGVYRPGKFFNASLDKASEDNERNSLLITTKDGVEVAVVQIAGLIARRIICDVKTENEVKIGARYGIIKFGSRVDIYLPREIEPLVLEGQVMIGGETILAKLSGEQQHLEGKKH